VMAMTSIAPMISTVTYRVRNASSNAKYSHKKHQKYL
jgi:hypothetical protein